MKIYPFGAKDAPVLLLLTGTCCHWKSNFGAVIPLLTDSFRVLCVSYDGFDETEQTEFPTMLEETKKIARGADGVISGDHCGEKRILSEDDTVSMSMWGFGAEFLPRLERQLSAFLEGLPADEPAAELTIADAVDAEIGSRGFRVQNLTTDSRWFGITYEADVDSARETLKSSIDSGVYPAPLWG